jgi:hypothetical protein
MQLTRQEDISLYLHVRDMILGPYYSEIAEGEELLQTSAGVWDVSYDTELDPFIRDGYGGLGRGMLYFDRSGTDCIFGTEQSSIVRVYSGSTTASAYSVNYLRGQILTTQDLTGYNVDYEWSYISVLDAWPFEDVPPLPVVSIELQDSRGLPLQLGYGDIRSAYWNIQIFASNKGERDDIMDILYDGIYQKRCPVYTFSNGLPLLRDGTYNSAFSAEYDSLYRYLFFENVKKGLSGLPQWGFYSQETVNRYRAEITFETSAFKS